MSVAILLLVARKRGREGLHHHQEPRFSTAFSSGSFSRGAVDGPTWVIYNFNLAQYYRQGSSHERRRKSPYQKFSDTANERLLKKLWPIVAQINSFEPHPELSDEELRSKTRGLPGTARRQLEGSTDLEPTARKVLEQEALDEILPKPLPASRSLLEIQDATSTSR
jgi:hypothetical protein